MAGITKEEVFDAAQMILEDTDGLLPDKVTLTQVRLALGNRGSMTTLTKHLRAWKEGFEAESKMPANLAVETSGFLNTLFAKARTQVAADMEAERNELLSEVEARETAVEGIEARNRELESDLAGAKEALREAQHQGERLTDETNRLTTMIDNRDEALSKADTQIAELSDRNLRLERENATLSEKLETAGKVEIAELRVQLAEVSSRTIDAEAHVKGLQQQLEDEKKKGKHS